MDGGLEYSSQVEGCGNDGRGERHGVEVDPVVTTWPVARLEQRRKKGARQYKDLARRFVAWRKRDM
jgi:hypothetical protein